MTKKSVWLWLAAILALGACGDDEDEAAAEEVGPLLGVMELPLSFRYDPAPPSGAANVEVSLSELRVNGQTLLTLENGSVAETALNGNEITPVSGSLGSATSAILRLHANTPYKTTTQLLHTLKRANVNQIALAVRQGVGTTEGFLRIDNYDVREQSDEWARFEGPAQRSWDELDPIWQAMYDACREGPYVDCAFKPTNIADGGQMQIELFLRGNAVKIEFAQFDAPEAEAPAGGAEMIEGVPTPPPGSDEAEEGTPATTGAFTWRFAATTEEPSSVTATMRPLCGMGNCGVVIEAEGQTATMRLASFLGAAFPNGTTAPNVLFQIPPR